MRDLAQVLMDIVTAQRMDSWDYNYSNEGEISWYEFVWQFKIGGYSCEVKGIPSSSYPLLQKASRFSLLDKTKIKRIYGVSVPDYG
jgi:dTDP-4-dehydrorhamnose reductase